jgi:hypothetical protein
MALGEKPERLSVKNALISFMVHTSLDPKVRNFLMIYLSTFASTLFSSKK